MAMVIDYDGDVAKARTYKGEALSRFFLTKNAQGQVAFWQSPVYQMEDGTTILCQRIGMDEKIWINSPSYAISKHEEGQEEILFFLAGYRRKDCVGSAYTGYTVSADTKMYYVLLDKGLKPIRVVKDVHRMDTLENFGGVTSEEVSSSSHDGTTVTNTGLGWYTSIPPTGAPEPLQVISGVATFYYQFDNKVTKRDIPVITHFQTSNDTVTYTNDYSSGVPPAIHQSSVDRDLFDYQTVATQPYASDKLSPSYILNTFSGDSVITNNITYNYNAVYDTYILDSPMPVITGTSRNTNTLILVGKSFNMGPNLGNVTFSMYTSSATQKTYDNTSYVPDGGGGPKKYAVSNASKDAVLVAYQTIVDLNTLALSNLILGYALNHQYKNRPLVDKDGYVSEANGSYAWLKDVLILTGTTGGESGVSIFGFGICTLSGKPTADPPIPSWMLTP